MPGRAVVWAVVAAFAAAVGHLAWEAFVGPPSAPGYFIGGPGQALRGANPENKQLYLRRLLYLPQRPRHAWIQLVGRDRLRLYVNGMIVKEEVLDGFPVGMVADLTPYLRVGKNVLAVTAKQASAGDPPLVAVDGAYLLDDGQHPLQSDDLWRCNGVFERKGAWWFSTEFDDRHWASARLVPCYLRARVKEPPRAAMAAGTGRWITPDVVTNGSAAVRREVDIVERPRQAWLRITATSSYRLAVNGILLDEEEDQLGTAAPVPPVQRIYDITPVVRQGHNVLALVLTSSAGRPHLLMDGEMVDGSGSRYDLGTGEQWTCRPGTPSDWLDTTLHLSQAGRPCEVESGDVGVPPWQPWPHHVEVTLPFPVVVQRVAGEIVFMALIGLLTLWACRAAAARLGCLDECTERTSLVYLALVPATVGVAAAVLATYDPRVARQDVYQGGWLWLVFLSVPLQWGVLALIARREGPHRSFSLTGMRRAATRRPAWWAVLALAVAGFWLRFHMIENEPLNPDEVTILRESEGIWERGWPSLKIADLPPQYKCGCELENVAPALASLVFRDDRYVSRFPMVCLGTLTIVLLYGVGRALFSPSVGLVAAAIYTFSPVCTYMANFGRYPSQLQVLTLLTVYFFYRTIAGSGPLDRRALWLTALCFLGMFFSWEASVFIAPGLVLAALVHRRGRLATILANPSVWAAMLIVLIAVLLQNAHKKFQTTQFLAYGCDWNNIKLQPMWLYPGFKPWRYVWAASWNRDALVPMLGLAAAAALTLRHAWRRQVRILMLALLTPCFLMSFFLSVIAERYSYHLTSLFVLLVAAAVVATSRALAALARQSAGSDGVRLYARGVAAAVAVCVIALGSGMVLQPADLPQFRVGAYEGGSWIPVYRFANFAGPARYLRDHLREGDVVLASHPDVVDHCVMTPADASPLRPDWSTDYWLQTDLEMAALLDDHRSLPLHHWCGTVMLSSLPALEDIFARHPRIWYVLQPDRHTAQNVADVSAYLRQHMDVVYEDYQTLVLFRDGNRPANQRQKDEKELYNARANFLP